MLSQGACLPCVATAQSIFVLFIASRLQTLPSPSHVQLNSLLCYYRLASSLRCLLENFSDICISSRLQAATLQLSEGSLLLFVC